MGDQRIRAAAAAQPVPEFGVTPFTLPPPLERARVALVTTAALHAPGEEALLGGDQTFRVLEPAEALVLGHTSPNFDRSGWLIDPNVVLPIGPLGVLTERGRIGSVAPRHIAFAGNQQDVTLATIRLDSGPAAARLLRDDGVDVALITGL